LTHFVNQAKTLKTIPHKLGKIVVKVRVKEFQVLLEIVGELFYIKKYFPKALLNKCQNAR
jgi:hypothetical protein